MKYLIGVPAVSQDQDGRENGIETRTKKICGARDSIASKVNSNDDREGE